MKGRTSFKNDNAVSEVVGGMLLVMIAVLVFSVIYVDVTSKDYAVYHTNVKLSGDVMDNGRIVLEHMSGDVVTSYRVVVNHPDGNPIGSKVVEEDDWEIGEYRYPLDDITDIELVDETVSLSITVFTTNEDGSEQIIFDGILSGRVDDYEIIIPPGGPSWEPGVPVLISSLLNNTIDEDLICFNYSIVPTIVPDTYIYNWLLNGDSIFDLYIPFNTDTVAESEVKDYSGNEFNGTIYGPVWSSGVVGGGYYFDGNDDYILLPYCYDFSYIDDISVEFWIQTDSIASTIASYDREKYWDVSIIDGRIRWTTTSNGHTVIVNGFASVNDLMWHHIVTTYESSTGNCAIYIDGNLDSVQNAHDPGDLLGSGESPEGYIGTSSNRDDIPGAWEVITYDDFEEGFGNYTDGGRDCKLYTASTYAHQGSNAANIQDNSGSYSSFYHTNSIDVHSSDYSSIRIDFWFIADGMESWEDFWVRYFDGNSWRKVADYDSGDEFVNGQFYHEIVWINETDYTFPTNMKIQFRCDASYDSDDVFIDQVYVNASTGSIAVDNYSGAIDEFIIYNKAISSEQAHQNYLCNRFGQISKSVIVSDELNLGESWQVTVTPNNAIEGDDAPIDSNSLFIVSYGGGE